MQLICVFGLVAALAGCQTAETFEVTAASVPAGTAITWNGEPTALGEAGTPLAVGRPLPDVQLTDLQMHPARLQAPGRVRLLSIVPSLDTPVCDVQTHALAASKALAASVERVTISADLPYAQRRFAAEAGLGALTYLSDYRDLAFGRAAGLRLARNGLLARALIVVDRQGLVRYLQVVPEITQLPDLARAVAAANALAN